MYTARDVFDLAVRLMDAQHETTGETGTADNREYLLRTPSLINSLLDRCITASDGVAASDGRRPLCPKLTAPEDPIDLDERLCSGVLPYGLAGLLLSGEDPARADFFWQTFLEQLHECRYTLPAWEEDVRDLYGGVGGGEFGQW